MARTAVEVWHRASVVPFFSAAILFGFRRSVLRLPRDTALHIIVSVYAPAQNVLPPLYSSSKFATHKVEQ